MSDDEIRRNVLGRAGWREDEIDRYLAAYPKPRTYAEQSAILGERLADLLFAACHALGIIALSRRLGLKPRPWAARRLNDESGPHRP